MTTESATNLERAARTFIARRDRTGHPDGNFDKAGRWYPSEAETCDCCSSVRSPSRAHPFSYMVHCRTMKHVANLFGVSVTDLRSEVRRLDPESAPASPIFPELARMPFTVVPTTVASSPKAFVAAAAVPIATVIPAALPVAA